MRRRRKIVRRLPPYTSDPDVIASLFYGHDSRAERNRISGGDGYVHVSELSNGLCPRAKFIAYDESVLLVNKPRPSDRIVWAIGRAVESHVRGLFLKSFGRKAAYGKWACACGTLHNEGMFNNMRRCTACGHKAEFYHEITLRNDEYMVVGNPDLVMIQGGAFEVVECKSIKTKSSPQHPGFDTLSEPFTGHVMQALMYRHLLKLAGHKVTPRVMIFYAAKDYAMKSPYKPFVVNATAPENEDAVKRLMDTAAAYVAARSRQRAPNRLGACSSRHSTTAKTCPVCEQCFRRGQ
jgi:hypothetical protein